MTLKSESPFSYPSAHRDDLVEDYHGTPVADPYRWLEDPDSPETTAFSEAQNELFQSFIADHPSKEKLFQRLKELWIYPQFERIFKRGNRYIFSKNDGTQDQPALYIQEGLEGEPKTLLDPNTLSKDGTVALNSLSPSKDGRYLAYGLSTSGSDWQEIFVRDTETHQDLDDLLKWTKFTEMAWKPDNSGFFYNTLPETGSVPEEDQNNYGKVYWHKIGTPQSKDDLIYEDPENKELAFYPLIDTDGHYLLMFVFKGTDPRNGIYYKKLTGDNDVVQLLKGDEARYEPIGNLGPTFYFFTDLDAPRGKIIAIDFENSGRENWKTIVPEGEDTIDFALMVNNQLVVVYKHHAHHQVEVYDLDGSHDRQIELPTLGSLLPLSGSRDDNELFLVFSTFTIPPSVYHYDFSSQKLTPFQEVELDFKAEDYETNQVFYSSKDGTKIPMFLIHKKGQNQNGDNPTLLYGYGGFNISKTPFFAVEHLVLLEQGWIFALANLRGGDEYGEEWHQAGMLENKQNVFDDFIAAGEWLIENKYTSTPKLAIHGRSNGGLLTAACMIHRPDLFGAVLSTVPVIDMLRYHKFTVGSYWTPEYGNAEENPEHFEFMMKYSPLHNVKAGETYPPLLIISADTDDRVVPAHAKKFAATLQHEAPSKNPLMLRIETKAGHGLGKPVSKLIEEYSEIYTFLLKVIGSEWK